MPPTPFRVELDFEKKKDEVLRLLNADEDGPMVLATSAHDRTTARTVLTINDGLDIFFFTWGQSRKCEQIRVNPRVALCREGLQIEGGAEVLGDLMAGHNRKQVESFRRRFPGAVERWEHRPGMVLVRVTPTLVAAGGSIGDGVWLEYLDLENEVSYAEQWAHY